MPAAAESDSEAAQEEDIGDLESTRTLAAGALRRRIVLTLGVVALAMALVLTTLPIRLRGGAGRSAAEEGLVGLEAGLIRQGREGMCLDVNGSYESAAVRVRSCAYDRPEMKFIFPRRYGMIRLTVDIGLCVQPERGRVSLHSKIVLSRCNDSDSAMQWELPADGTGPIRLQHRRSLCIEESAQHQAILGACPLHEQPGLGSTWHPDLPPVLGQFLWNGTWCLGASSGILPGPIFMSHDCWGWLPPTHFSYFPGRSGLIRFAANPDMCINALPDDTIYLDHCNDTAASMQWKVPDDQGPLRLVHQPGKCIQGVAAQGAAVVLHDCAHGVPDIPFQVYERQRNVATPSLLCVCAMKPWGYEQEIFTALLKKGQEQLKDVGIFDCNEFSIYSSESIELGWHHWAGSVRTVKFDQASVGVSKDGTAGNTQLFMNMWGAVRFEQKYGAHDWTIKVDPDCVLLPDRMRGSLAPRTNNDAVFIKNCNAFVGDPEFPMMYGAVEAFSKSAMYRYFDNGLTCAQELPWYSWGEDLYMKRCMERLGVAGVLDENIVGDRLCFHSNDCNQWHPSYHPFKSKDEWIACYDTATR